MFFSLEGKKLFVDTKMAQRSIMSFFKPKSSPVGDAAQSNEAAASKRRRIASSSDEDTTRRTNKVENNGIAKKSKCDKVNVVKKKTQPANRYNGLVDSESGSEEEEEVLKETKVVVQEERQLEDDAEKQESKIDAEKDAAEKQESKIEIDAEEDAAETQESKIESDAEVKTEKPASKEISANQSKTPKKTPAKKQVKVSVARIKKATKTSEDTEVKEPVKAAEDTKVKTEEKDQDTEDQENESVKIDKPKPKIAAMFTSSKTDISLDQNKDGADYNPAKPNYHPINDVFWKKGEKTPYLALARTFQLIEEIRGRYNMLDILGNFFSSILLLNPDDLLPAVCLSVNQLAPAYEGLELGVAETFIMKAICSATGRAMKFIKDQAHATGDLGIVAEQSRVAQRMMFRPAPLTVQDIFKKLKEIARMSSGNDKTDKIQTMLVACRYSEARFIIRSLLGKLRIGLAEQSLMMALSIALLRSGFIKKGVPPGDMNIKGKITTDESFKQQVEEKALILKITYCQCPNYDKIIPTLLEYGLDELLERCPMLPGIPVKPMLAQPTKGVVEVLKRLDGLKITCEWKYDGERAQIHYEKKTGVKIYSRNQEDNTSKYPDVIARLSSYVKPEVESYILDSEIVAWDCERKQILPFQILSTRKRKNADINEIKVQVCIYAFDLLYLNGQPLVTQVLGERRKHLREQFMEVEGEFQFATSADTNDADEVVQFLEDSIKGNCEGLMVKTLEKEATYEIAKRSRNWLKLKKDYMSGVGDSLDLVVVGGYRGRGRRTGAYGGFLLACYDTDNEEYQTICKIGTGFSDEDLQTHANFFKDHVISESKSYYSYDKSLEPDEWFDAVQVWEVKCADLSLSPVHRAGIGIIDAERGISLRFPRFIRIRDDKTAENATSAQQVADMYLSQDQIKNQQTEQVNNSFENDFY